MPEETTTTTTLDKVEVGMFIRPVPGTYKSRLTRTQRKTQQPVTLAFGEEFAGSKFVKVTRHGNAKRAGTYDVGFGPGQSWHAYPGTVKVELKPATKRQRQADATRARKNAGAAAAKAQADPDRKTTKVARSRQPVDAKLADQVKKLRDEGMAWWKIGVELSLPGGGPLPAGKRGAGQARKLYKAANNGELPASARSNGGSRNVTKRAPSPAKRRRNALGLAAMTAAELREALEGKTITYNYTDPSKGTADPVKVEKVKTTTLVEKGKGKGKLSVTFWSERSREGFGNERTVYADQIVEVR